VLPTGAEAVFTLAVDEVWRQRIEVCFGVVAYLETLRFEVKRPPRTQPLGKIVDAYRQGINFDIVGRVNIGGAVSERSLEDAVFVDHHPLVEFSDKIPGEVLIEESGTGGHGRSLSF